MAVLCAMEGISCESERCLPVSTADSEIKRVLSTREKKGCIKPTSHVQFRLKDTGENFYRCPVALVKRESWMYIGIYNMMKAGHLPYGGGSLDQPANLMIRLKLIGSFEQMNSKE